MRCPYCANEDTRVVDSRLGDGGESVRRRRECLKCEERFTTQESIVLQLPPVIKSDNTREKFDEEKLRGGIMRALEKRPIESEQVEGAIKRVIRQFTHKGEREISSRDIGEAVMHMLSELDEVAYVRFASVYRKFRGLDEFDAEVEKLRGALISQPHQDQDTIFGGKKK